MFSNIAVESPPVHHENTNLRNIYYRVQSFLRRGTDTMLSARSTATSEDSFVTPVSSVGDLLALSPKRVSDDLEQTADVTTDLLTGSEFDSICDVTMHEVPTFDDNLLMDSSSLDYLVKCAGSNRNNTHVDRGKESLFVKFDPLYTTNQRQGSFNESVGDSAECDVGYETGSTASIMTENNTGSPKQTSSFLMKDKPTQVVPPVVNGTSKQHPVHSKSTPALTRSLSAILAPTQVATDRLICISGSTPPTAAPRSPRFHNNMVQSERLQSLRIILEKQDHEIMHLTQENRQLKSRLQDMQYKSSETVEDLQAKVKKLKDEKDNLLERENKLIQQINDKIMSNKQMSIVMEEYEKSISSLIGEQQRDKVQSQDLQEKLASERDQALDHLSSMESSFNDLLSKYEKSKSIIMEAKEREKMLVQKCAEYEVGMKKYEELYNDLKNVTSDNLNKANETLENIKKSHNVEIMKLNATIKKHEIKIASLEESFAQISRDNEELTRICDQLINGVR